MGRELDVKVARALGQIDPPTLHERAYAWRWNDDHTWEGEHYWDTHSWRSWNEVRWPPCYSTNIAAAWELVDGCDGKFYLSRADGVWMAMFGDDLDLARFEATAPEAICKAFLAWKEG